jgi:hypothetical protein
MSAAVAFDLHQTPDAFCACRSDHSRAGYSFNHRWFSKADAGLAAIGLNEIDASCFQRGAEDEDSFNLHSPLLRLRHSSKSFKTANRSRAYISCDAKRRTAPTQQTSRRSTLCTRHTAPS